MKYKKIYGIRKRKRNRIRRRKIYSSLKKNRRVYSSRGGFRF